MTTPRACDRSLKPGVIDSDVTAEARTSVDNGAVADSVANFRGCAWSRSVAYFLDDELALGDLVEQHAGRSTEETFAIDA